MIDSTHTLFPGGAPLAEQMEHARSILATSSRPEHLAHAKCFLTYRCLDGLLSLDEWTADVQSVVVGVMIDPMEAVRWRVSQETAEFYLRVLMHGECHAPWVQSDILADCQYHRSAILNWGRVQLILGHDSLAVGDQQTAGRIAIHTLRISLAAVAAVPFTSQPLRVMEMRDDWHLWAALVLLGQASGVIAGCHSPWADAAALSKAHGHLPYMRCVQAIHQRAKGLQTLPIQNYG